MLWTIWGRAGFVLIPNILDYLWPLFDSVYQLLHDKMISPIVVRV